MRIRHIAALVALTGAMIIPATASAQTLKQESEHRQKQKNQWRNLAIGAGLVSLYGLLKHDNTITFAGAAGALYSLDRYEKDRKSQAKTDQARASIFSRSTYTRNGVRYKRVLVKKNGKRYYQFVRAR